MASVRDWVRKECSCDDDVATIPEAAPVYASYGNAAADTDTAAGSQ